MLKLVCLILGAVIGFGGGVYWATHNPDAASKLSAEEERRFLEAQMQITKSIQAKLEQLQLKTPAAGGRSSFVAPSESPVVAAEVEAVKKDTQKQQADLQQRINALK